MTGQRATTTTQAMTDKALFTRLAAPLIALALSLSACTYILGDSLSSAARPCVVESDCDPGQVCAAGRCGAPSADTGVEDEPDQAEDATQDQAGPDSLEFDQGGPDQAEDAEPPPDAPPEDMEAPELPPDDQGGGDLPPEEVADVPDLPPMPACVEDNDCEVGICDLAGVCVLQCDDALPCVGTPCSPQVCVDGRCVVEPVSCEMPPAPRCEGDALMTPTGDGACEEESGECVYAMTATSCAAQGSDCQAMICDSARGACAPGASAEDGVACVGERGAGVCDQGQCVDCSRNDQCPDSGDPCMANACRGGRCVLTPQNRAPCGDRCHPGVCNNRGACDLGAPVTCDVPPDQPCLEGACDPLDGSCGTRPRANGTECRGDEGGVCFGGTCVACIGDDDCAAPPLAPCQESVCTNNACEAGPIMIGATCGAPDLYCAPSGRCVQCEVDGECNDNNACTTDTCVGERCQNMPVPDEEFLTLCIQGEVTAGVCRAGVCEASRCEQDDDCQRFSDNGQRCVAPFCNQGACDEVALPDGRRCQGSRGGDGVCLGGECQVACDTAICTGGDACAAISCQDLRSCSVSYMACDETRDCAACDPDPRDCVAVLCEVDSRDENPGSSPTVCVPSPLHGTPCALGGAAGEEGRCVAGVCVPSP